MNRSIETNHVEPWQNFGQKLILPNGANNYSIKLHPNESKSKSITSYKVFLLCLPTFIVRCGENITLDFIFINSPLKTDESDGGKGELNYQLNTPIKSRKYLSKIVYNRTGKEGDGIDMTFKDGSSSLTSE